MKRDKIFYIASSFLAVGILLALLGSDYSLFLFVAAYLLRPLVMEFGLGAKFADEREQTIHAKSGDVAFIIIIVAVIGFSILRISHGQRPEELYEIIGIGLAARALTGLIMNGEYRKAGVLIINAVGFFLGLFIVLEAGVSAASLFGVAVALIIFGIGWIAKKYPRLIAVVLSVIVIGTIIGLQLYQFRLVGSGAWLFLVTPLTIAAASLFLSASKDRDFVAHKVRTMVFGSLAISAVIIFSLLMIFGSREERHSITFQQLNEGEVQQIQGYPCHGTVNYFENGKIASCILAQEFTVLGHSLPAGTQLNFASTGTVAFICLPSATYIQTYLCKGEGPTTWHTVFYPDGQLKLLWPAKDQWIQDVPCREASFWTDAFGGGAGVHFYPNGKLKYCKLSEDIIIQGHLFKRGDHIHFNENGQIMNSR